MLLTYSGQRVADTHLHEVDEKFVVIKQLQFYTHPGRHEQKDTVVKEQ